MRPILATAILLAATLGALPAAAQTVTHSVEGRFGVTYDSGAENGAAATRGIYDGRYTMTVRHPLDNGWSLGVAISVEAGNVQRRGPRAWRDLQPGLRLDRPGS